MVGAGVFLATPHPRPRKPEWWYLRLPYCARPHLHHVAPDRSVLGSAGGRRWGHFCCDAARLATAGRRGGCSSKRAPGPADGAARRAASICASRRRGCARPADGGQQACPADPTVQADRDACASSELPCSLHLLNMHIDCGLASVLTEVLLERVALRLPTKLGFTRSNAHLPLLRLWCRGAPLVVLAAGVCSSTMSPASDSCDAVQLLRCGGDGHAEWAESLPCSRGVTTVLALPSGRLAGAGLCSCS